MAQGNELITMNHNQIVGDDIHNLGYTELEADYTHQHDWRCWAKTAIEALLFAAFMLMILALCIVIQWWQQGGV